LGSHIDTREGPSIRAHYHLEILRGLAVLAVLSAVVGVCSPACGQWNGGAAGQPWESLHAGVLEERRAGNLTRAAKLAEQALSLARKAFGDRAPQTVSILDNLALIYYKQSRYSEAEPLYREALQTRRALLGARHPDTLTSLNNLAILYMHQAAMARQSTSTGKCCGRGAWCWGPGTPTR
jgi:tetratricopeptide (TPR) repeat protein